MGKAIVRVGDVNSGGGTVISGENSVLVNGLPVAVDGSPVSCHTPGKGDHTHATCRASQSTIFANGKAIIFVNDVDSCGHARIKGAATVSGS